MEYRAPWCSFSWTESTIFVNYSRGRAHDAAVLRDRKTTFQAFLQDGIARRHCSVTIFIAFRALLWRYFLLVLVRENYLVRATVVLKYLSDIH